MPLIIFSFAVTIISFVIYRKDKKKNNIVSKNIFGVLTVIVLLVSILSTIDYIYPVKGEMAYDSHLHKVEEIIPETKSNFHFITVSNISINGNLSKYFYEYINKDKEIHFKDLSESPYEPSESNNISVTLLEESQSKVYLGVSHALGESIEYEKKVIVGTVLSKHPSTKDLLKPDDIISKIENQSITSKNQIFEILQDVTHDLVVIEIKRKNEGLKQVNIKLDENYQHPFLVMGFYPIEKFKIKTPEYLPTLNIRKDIIGGGDSAGLMMGLQMYYNIPKNFNAKLKNYKIAGTGSIQDKGEIMAVGGIYHKVLAAFKGEVDVLFVPEQNAEEAFAVQKKLNAEKMPIIPVSHLKEAIEYIDSL